MPLKATPVAAGIFLTSDGRVIDGGNNGQVVATQVSAAGQLITGPSGWRMPLKKSDGTCVYTGGAGEIAAVGVPSGSTPVAAGIFLAPDGRVIDGGSNGQVLATNIASTGQLITGQVGWRLPMKKNDGSCVYTDGVNLINANGVPTDLPPLPLAFSWRPTAASLMAATTVRSSPPTLRPLASCSLAKLVGVPAQER